MKTKAGTISVGIAVIVVIAGIGDSFMRGEATLASAPAAQSDASIPVVPENPLEFPMQVDDLAAHPERFQKEFLLKGVVAGTNPEEGVFGVIDAREFEECRVLTCATNIIPVKLSGELPEPKSVVYITGRLVRAPQGYLIKASRVEFVP